MQDKPTATEFLISSVMTSTSQTTLTPPISEGANLPCPSYIRLVVGLIDDSMSSHVNENQTFSLEETQSSFDAGRQFLNNVISPTVCMFGIIGNFLNLIVLTRKQLQRSMDRMERSVSVSLVALAASDLISCVIYMTATLVHEKALYSPLDRLLDLYFKIYQEGLINVFMLTSTWLTVNMAVGRYVAICYPLHARGFINLRATRVAVVCIFLASILLNLPRFWHFYAHPTSCSNFLPSLNSLPSTMEGTSIQTLNASCQCTYYTKIATIIYRDNATWFVFVHGLVYSILGVFLPLIVLTVCNVCLIKALRRSYQMQTMYRANKPVDSGHRITPTLIAIIVLFTILVTPADLVNFARLTTDYHNYQAQEMATDITNFLLTINYSANFVLYCVVSTQFRRTMHNLMFCKWYQANGTSGVGTVTTMEYYTATDGIEEGSEGKGRPSRSGPMRACVLNLDEPEVLPMRKILERH